MRNENQNERTVNVPDDELAFTPMTELLTLLSQKKVSPVEITHLYIRRIERLNIKLNAYLECSFDQARIDAKSAEQSIIDGNVTGPLMGVPVSVKDLEMTAGIRTTGGSLIFKDRIPNIDSIVVERIKEAGGIILGKTNTPEFGLLGETRNRLGDDCRNPWDLNKTSGGSSGGAAVATVSGMCAVATGSDGGGSIRIPASFTGTYGIKPTQGRVPRYPVLDPHIANHTSQSGPISRTVKDSALLLQLIAGHDKRDPSSLSSPVPDLLSAVSRDISGLRIGWTPDFGFAKVDPEIEEICQSAAKSFEDLGCYVDESDLKMQDPFEQWYVLFALPSMIANTTIWPSRSRDMSDYVRQAYRAGEKYTTLEYARALGHIDTLRVKLEEQFQIFDLLISPTMAVPPYDCSQPPRQIKGEDIDGSWACLPFTYPINMTGNPAASIPAGMTSSGLPVGLHIIGRIGAEDDVVAASAAFEKAYPWAHLRPSAI